MRLDFIVHRRPSQHPLDHSLVDHLIPHLVDWDLYQTNGDFAN